MSEITRSEYTLRIKTVRLRNFRSFSDETIPFSEITRFVGENGAGKSSVLCALNIFFRNNANPTAVTSLSEEDFCLGNTAEPVEITITFADLTDAAKRDLGAYVRHDSLAVVARAVWNGDQRRADVKQYGSRLVMAPFSSFFEAEKAGKLVGELRPLYQTLRQQYSDLPDVATKNGMLKGLREYEEAHPELCEMRESEDEFYGWTRGVNRLAPHVQWVYVPAVKDATEEEMETRTSALGLLLNRTIRARVDFGSPIAALRRDMEERYEAIVADRQDVLSEVSTAIQGRLQAWSHPGVTVEIQWHFDPAKAIAVDEPVAKVRLGEGHFAGDLARLGHGLQRSFIVAVLTELATTEHQGQPTLILGLEEPELYQHPPQARHLAQVLEELAGGQSQVVITTHSPYFVAGHAFESVRMTRKESRTGKTRVTHLTHEALAARLSEALREPPASPTAVMAQVEQIMQPSLNELFFSRLPVLVEGLEDVAYISTHFHLRGDWNEFRRLRGHLVACGGKGPMSRALATAEGFGFNPYVIFDCDSGDSDGEQHQRDNKCLLHLCGLSDTDAFPVTTVGPRAAHWHKTLHDEIMVCVGDAWKDAMTAAKTRMGIPGKLSAKNVLWIAATLEILRERGVRCEVLDQVCDAILEHGRSLD